MEEVYFPSIVQMTAWGAVAQEFKCWVLLNVYIGKASKREVDVTWATGYLHDFKSLMDTLKPLKQFSWMRCHNPSWNSCSCRTYLLIRKSSCLGDLCAESCTGCQWTGFSVNPAFFYGWHFPGAEEIPPGAASAWSWVWCSLHESWRDCTRAVLDVLLTPSVVWRQESLID